MTFTVPPGTARHLSLPGARRRGLTIAFVSTALVILLFWRHVVLVTSVAYTYAWWVSPTLHYASACVLDDDAAAGASRCRGAPKNPPVPRIIHQTWKDREIPDKWKEARRSCIDLHPDYEYRLWTDADAADFIKRFYPWFLPTYWSYPYDIQRADAIRYFILLHHGGVYMDLDVGCRKPVDFLLNYDFSAPATYPVGISNDILAARPGAPFLKAAIKELKSWNMYMGMKYVQVMFSAGPMFLTAQMATARGNASDVTVIPTDLYGKYEDSGSAHWYHLHGSSWHADDAALVFWADGHRWELAAVLAAAVGAVLGRRGLHLLRERRGRKAAE